MNNLLVVYILDLKKYFLKDIEESGLDCAHITYNNLIKDPVAVVQQIYKQFGWHYSEEYDKVLKVGSIT